MRHVVCTLLLWLLTTVPVMASPPVGARDSAPLPTCTWREYVGNCVYENDTLRMVLIDGGYITFEGAARQPLYHYYAKDYLGNNRAVADEAGRIEGINHYYPFGGLMGDSRSTATQPYKYIGKELDRTHASTGTTTAPATMTP